jgi:hypothetical protein
VHAREHAEAASKQHALAHSAAAAA